MMNMMIPAICVLFFTLAADASLAAEKAEQAPDASLPIRIARARPAANPLLLQAYEKFQAGDFAAARDAYEMLLAGDPNNLDALHGMAAISLRQGKAVDASQYYRRALDADPRDVLAQVWLIGMQERIDPLLAETRLKLLLSSQPELFYASFALGNLYASQHRWREAQAAYFSAYSVEPGDPDILFNLAVSLDQLRQAEQAAHYYRQALLAAESRPAAFDRNQLVVRLGELAH
jgi:Tfp pilus assembly protein PilF